MRFVVFAGTGSSTGASVIVPCVNRIVPIMIDCANNPGILCNFGITVGVAEVFTTGFACPVFLVSICCAGGVFLRSMYHIAVCHRHGARGAYLTAIRSGGGNGGAAGAYGGYFTACIYRSNAGVAAFPNYIFIGGIVRLYCSSQNITTFFL